jgi:hypothetical protein
MAKADLEVIVACLRRARRAVLGVTLSTIAITLFFGASVYYREGASEAVVALGTAVLVGAVLSLLFLLKKARVESSRIYRLLNKEPEQIAWVYDVATRKRLRRQEHRELRTVRFHLKNGRYCHLRGVQADEIAQVMDAIKACAPEARIGYSEELDQQYRDNPDLMLDD